MPVTIRSGQPSPCMSYSHAPREGGLTQRACAGETAIPPSPENQDEPRTVDRQVQFAVLIKVRRLLELPVAKRGERIWIARRWPHRKRGAISQQHHNPSGCRDCNISIPAVGKSSNHRVLCRLGSPRTERAAFVERASARGEEGRD